MMKKIVSLAVLTSGADAKPATDSTVHPSRLDAALEEGRAAGYRAARARVARAKKSPEKYVTDARKLSKNSSHAPKEGPGNPAECLDDVIEDPEEDVTETCPESDVESPKKAVNPAECLDGPEKYVTETCPESDVESPKKAVKEVVVKPAECLDDPEKYVKETCPESDVESPKKAVPNKFMRQK